ncbi:hypothetical protein ACYZT9_09090 [Pseudomonas sp. ZT5P21]
MPELKNFVAVDWRSGKDAIHFYFKDINKYSRFNIGDNEVPEGYPSRISDGNWGSFHAHVKHLKFGFTTTDLFNEFRSNDEDSTWLFFLRDGVEPYVCKYDQDNDKVEYMRPVAQSVWAPLLPYFSSIVAGTWWQAGTGKMHFRFLMNNGNFLLLDYDPSAWYQSKSPFDFGNSPKPGSYTPPRIRSQPITDSTWPGLERYKDRIITAVQNDRTFDDSLYYIFLTNNEYIRFNMSTNRAESGPIKVDETSWPGLLRD